MADERIDIEVTDKGADRAAANIRKIGDEAERTSSYVERLRAQLAGINSSPVEKLSRAMAAQEAQLSKLTAAQTRQLKLETDLATSKARLAEATSKAELAAIRLATAQGKVSDSSSKVAASAATATAALESEAAAQARIAAMVESSLANQASALGPKRAPGFVPGAKAAAARDAIEGAAGAGAAAAGVRDLEKAAEELGTKGPGFFAAFKTGAVGAFDTIRDFVTGNGTRFRGVAKDIEAGVEGIAASAAKATPHIKGSSTAIRELLVLAREGSRGDFTRMAGSASILATAIGVLPVALAAAAVGFIGLFTAQKAWNTPEEQAKLKGYATDLGLTEKEMRKLTNTTVDASGKLKEHNVLQLEYGDILGGVLDTAKQYGAQLLENMGVTKDGISDVSNHFLSVLKGTFAVFYGLVLTLVDIALGAAKRFYNAFYNLGVGIANGIIIVFQTAVNLITSVANGAIKAYNWVATKLGGTAVEEFKPLKTNVKSITDGMRSLRVETDVAGNVARRAGEAYRTLDRIGADIKRNAEARAKTRVQTAAQAIVANRNPKKASTADPKTQGDFLADENKKLDDQLRRMSMLRDAREIQTQLDTIEESFLKRRMPLDQAQIEAFRAKLVAIQEGKRVQAESDRIYGDSVDTLLKYNATIAATNSLLAQNGISQVEATFAVNEARRALEAHNDVIGANAPLRTYQEALDKITLSLARQGITQEQANQQTVIAKRNYDLATQPLLAMSEALDVATAASKSYGIEAQRATYYEQVRQTMLKQGIILSAAYVAGQNAEVDALMKKNDALQAQTNAQTVVGGIVNPMLQDQQMLDNKKLYYAEIDRLRQTDVLNEEQAQRAKLALDMKFNEMRLSAVSGFFGNLADVTSKGTGAIGAISKAAAVAQATIDGYVAVQKALASAPPPWNFIAAAGVAIKTGAQVAGILSTNVGSFNEGGSFVVGGRDGVDKNNINMNVTKGEKVTIETLKQQRANDNGGGPTHVSVPVKVVNVTDPNDMLAAMDGEDGDNIIFNSIQRNPNRFSQLVKQTA